MIDPKKNDEDEHEDDCMGQEEGQENERSDDCDNVRESSERDVEKEEEDEDRVIETDENHCHDEIKNTITIDASSNSHRKNCYYNRSRDHICHEGDHRQHPTRIPSETSIEIQQRGRQQHHSDDDRNNHRHRSHHWHPPHGIPHPLAPGEHHPPVIIAYPAAAPMKSGYSSPPPPHHGRYDHYDGHYYYYYSSHPPPPIYYYSCNGERPPIPYDENQKHDVDYYNPTSSRRNDPNATIDLKKRRNDAKENDVDDELSITKASSMRRRTSHHTDHYNHQKEKYIVPEHEQALSEKNKEQEDEPASYENSPRINTKQNENTTHDLVLNNTICNDYEIFDEEENDVIEFETGRWSRPKSSSSSSPSHIVVTASSSNEKKTSELEEAMVEQEKSSNDYDVTMAITSSSSLEEEEQQQRIEQEAVVTTIANINFVSDAATSPRQRACTKNPTHFKLPKELMDILKRQEPQNIVSFAVQDGDDENVVIGRPLNHDNAISLLRFNTERRS